jgi:hypothetical protein
MKRILMILMLLTIVVSFVYAEENEAVKIKATQKFDVPAGYNDITVKTHEMVGEDKKKTKNIEITMFGENDNENSGAFMGVFTEDLTLDQAYQKGYREMYGILVTGIGPNSPAQKYKLMVDDILMKINDNKITNKDQLLKIIQSYAPDDAAQLTVFRNGAEMSIPFVFGSKGGSEKSSGAMMIPGGSKKKSHSVGYGGGTWTPIWFMLNTDDVNQILANTHDNLGSGYKKISDKGLFLNGGAGKGNIGKGYFIGGMGAGYELEKNYRDGADSTHKMKYEVSFGGVTLDKRIHIAQHVTGSLGFLLGGGQQTIDVVRQRYLFPDGGYNWDNISSVNLNKDEVKMKRSYFVFQPKAEVLYHLVSWMAIRGEVGYTLGYSGKDGWEVVNDHNAQVTNSPNSSFDGWTFSIGPWFGF